MTALQDIFRALADPTRRDILGILAQGERTIAEVYEPYYIKEGFLMLTPGGRVATDAAYAYFDYPVGSQTSLFH